MGETIRNHSPVRLRGVCVRACGASPPLHHRPSSACSIPTEGLYFWPPIRDFVFVPSPTVRGLASA